MNVGMMLKVGAGLALAVMVFIAFQKVSNHLKEFDRRGIAEAVETYKASDLEARLKEETRLRKLAEDQRDDAEKIGDANEASRVERTVVYRTIKEEIQNAPPTDDAPVAPVLSRAIERLSGTGQETGNQDSVPDEASRSGGGPTPEGMR